MKIFTFIAVLGATVASGMEIASSVRFDSCAPSLWLMQETKLPDSPWTPSWTIILDPTSLELNPLIGIGEKFSLNVGPDLVINLDDHYGFADQYGGWLIGDYATDHVKIDSCNGFFKPLQDHFYYWGRQQFKIFPSNTVKVFAGGQIEGCLYHKKVPPKDITAGPNLGWSIGEKARIEFYYGFDTDHSVDRKFRLRFTYDL